MSFNSIADDSTSDEIRSFLKRCRAYATKRGYGECADDFAQETYIKCARGRKTSLKNLFTDFLRASYGSSRINSESRRRNSKFVERSFKRNCSRGDDARLAAADTCFKSSDIPSVDELPWGTWLELDRTLEKETFDFLLQGWSEVQISDLYGVTGSRISQIRKQIKTKVKNAIDTNDIWDRYHYEDACSKFCVDWISI